MSLRRRKYVVTDANLCDAQALRVLVVICAVKVRKPAQAVERAARSVKDLSEFVVHVAGIVQRYRHELRQDVSEHTQAVRQALRAFERQSAALIQWLAAAHRERGAGAPERAALDRIGLLLDGTPGPARAASKVALDWLTQAQQAAQQCADDLKSGGKRGAAAEYRAAQVAAEGLRATLEHHQVKFSLGSRREPSAIVQLFCVLAKHAGDTGIDVEQARALLSAVGKTAR